ncbi:MAG: hypothetical protein J1E56_02635 [Ruminococcus sp.]|nr:hypothetical protein [Ruminococcus sp.]
MYPYHNMIKKRIKNGELIGFTYVDDYKNIGECLLLFFNTPPYERPVRPHKYYEYINILENWKIKQEQQNEKEKRNEKEIENKN